MKTMPVAPLDKGHPRLRELLDKYDLRPRKGLGQHFLADPNILRKIVEAAELSSEDVVLEVGPGLGTLTWWLAQAVGRVIAVELDEAMISVLREELGHLSNLEVVQGDILQLDPAALVRHHTSSRPRSLLSYIVVANLPYYITSAAIRHLLEGDPPPRRLELTVQREVAQRIVATPGDMSLLAVSVQFYGRPRIVASIPAGAFIPSPNVDSAVVRVDTYDTPPVEVSDPKFFFHLVRAGFGQKRKQLKNALAAGLARSSSEVAAALERAGVEPRRRAETLTLEEWGRLAYEFDVRG
jgi:16S rRNA (adenine1518-N6/adenine1519-N6)-dimethyltransferase